MAIKERPLTNTDSYPVVEEAVPGALPWNARLLQLLGRMLGKVSDIQGVAAEEPAPATLLRLLELSTENRNAPLAGGGTITFGVSATNRLKWSLPLKLFTSSEYASDFYVDLTMPTSSVLDSGNSEHAGADGILLGHLEGLWVIHTRGGAHNVGNTWRVAEVGSTLEGQLYDDADAFQIALCVNENGINAVYLRNGTTLVHGQSVRLNGAGVAGVGSVGGYEPTIPGGGVPLLAGANIGISASGSGITITGAAGAATGLTVVGNASLLSTITGWTDATVRFLIGYNGAQTGGEGYFIRDAADTTTPVNNGTVFASADGGRIKRIWSAPLNIEAFGCRGDDSFDNTTRLQAALDTGARLYVPRGTFRITAKVDWSVSGTVIEGPGTIKQVTAAQGAIGYSGGVTNCSIYGVTIIGAATGSTSAIGVSMPANSEMGGAAVGWFNRNVELHGSDCLAVECELSEAQLGSGTYDGTAIVVRGPDGIVAENRISGSKYCGIAVLGDATYGGGLRSNVESNRIDAGHATHWVDAILVTSTGAAPELESVNVDDNIIHITQTIPDNSTGLSFVGKVKDSSGENNTVRGASYASYLVHTSTVDSPNRISFESNTSIGATGYDWAVTDTGAGGVSEASFINGKTDRPGNRAFIDQGVDTTWINNDGLQDIEPLKVLAGATPSVGAGQNFIATNVSATVITNLLDGRPGQKVKIILDDFTSIQNNANISLAQGRSIPAHVGGMVVELVRSATKWLEVAGSIWIPSPVHEAQLEGLQVRYSGVNSVILEPGVCYIPGFGGMAKNPAEKPADFSFPASVTAQRYMYVFADANGEIQIDPVLGTTEPVFYSGTWGMHKPSDPTRRYVMSLWPNGAASPTLRKWRWYSGELIEWLDDMDGTSTYILENGKASTTQTVTNSALWTPPPCRLIRVGLWAESWRKALFGNSEDTLALSSTSYLHQYQPVWEVLAPLAYEVDLQVDSARSFEYRWESAQGVGEFGMYVIPKGYWMRRR